MRKMNKKAHPDIIVNTMYPYWYYSIYLPEQLTTDDKAHNIFTDVPRIGPFVSILNIKINNELIYSTLWFWYIFIALIIIQINYTIKETKHTIPKDNRTFYR